MHAVVERRLFQLGQNCRAPTEMRPGRRDPTASGENLIRVVITVKRHADLSEIVRTRDAPSRLARRLHGRQQERHQHPDDRDHDQEFDEGETPPSAQFERAKTNHGKFVRSVRAYHDRCGQGQPVRNNATAQPYTVPYGQERTISGIQRPTNTPQPPSLAEGRRQRVGRSSDSRAIGKVGLLVALVSRPSTRIGRPTMA